TSERIVASASPAAARARTNPASTSVSNAASSSGPAGTRASRRSRTTARLNLGPLTFTDPARSVLETIDPQETRNNVRRHGQPGRSKNPPVQGLDGLKGPQGTLGIFIRKRTCPPGRHLASGLPERRL